MMFIKKLISILITTICLCISMASYSLPIKKNPEIQMFIKQMVKNYHFNKNQLRAWFTKAQFNQAVIGKIEHPYEGKPWDEYRTFYVSPYRVTHGILFWKKNQATLRRAEKTYGVPAAIIVAIIGVETKYGLYMGSFSVFNTLTTLAFRYPKRQKFFRNELVQFLLLAREQKWNPFSIKGSYAGAIGMPQFMPSSYRAYAVDFNKNGKIDLIHSEADAIGSVANYLKQHGWKRKQSIIIPAILTKGQKLNTPINNLSPTLTVKKLSQYGIKPKKRLPNNTQVTVIRLNENNINYYWIGLNNFSVITKYNTNIKYAMATYILANKIKNKVGTMQKLATSKHLKKHDENKRT